MKRSKLVLLGLVIASLLLTSCKSANSGADIDTNQTQDISVNQLDDLIMGDSEDLLLPNTYKPKEAYTYEIKLNQADTVFNYYEEGSEDYISSYSYQTLELLDPAEAPTLSRSLSEYAASIYSDLSDRYAKILDSATDSFKSGYLFEPYYLMHTIAANRCDSLVCSLISIIYSFTGGAHPNYTYETRVLDSQTGAQLKLTDVLSPSITSDYSLLVDFIEFILVTDYPEIEYNSLLYHDFILQGLESETINWTLQNDGISFIFNPYDICAYAFGSPSVFIPFVGHEDVFNSKYIEAPKAFSLGLSSTHEFTYDLDGDGSKEYISVFSADYPSHDYIDFDLDLYNNLHITCDSTYYGSEDSASLCLDTFINGHDIEYAFVHTETGNYIYVSAIDENDLTCLYVYELTAGEIKGLGSIEGRVRNITANFNPSNFYFETGDSISSHRVGADGFPAPILDDLLLP